MSQPFFSCLCLTAGRVSLLEEAIAAFEAQDYQGQSELVILNTLPEQHLELDPMYEDVHVINLPERPKSLGEARNMAVAHSNGNWFVTWDDDDQYLSNHLSNFAAHAEGKDWLWMNRQFYLLGRNIKSIVQGSSNVLAFTHTAWTMVGGYRAMNCGEDRDFVGRVTSQCNGTRIELPDDKISFLYAWGHGPGVYHQSGEGDDKPGRLTSWERAHAHLQRQLKSRQIPSGNIMLKPAMRHDYKAMVRALVSSTQNPVEATRKVGDVAVVLLGRFGDIINILPVLRHIAESYGKPSLVVSRQFASVLDGVSYVEPFPVDLPQDTLQPAIKLAREHFRHVIVAQPWSKDWPHPGQTRKTEAYNKDSWRMAGFEHKFNDPTWLPVFDRRNLVREEALVNALDVHGRPMLLLKLEGSISSPWLAAASLGKRITTAFRERFNIVHLGTVRAERIFDLLGLMGRAAALVTIDTSILHLAAASAVPCVALVNPNPWLGSLPRCRCVRRITYTEAECRPTWVVDAIAQAALLDNSRLTNLGMATPVLRQPPKRRLIHAYEQHQDGMDARKKKAQISWTALYSQGVIPEPLKMYARDARSVGDGRRLPFLKDVLLKSVYAADPDDLIMFTNDDVVLHPELPELLLFHCAVYGPVSSQRCEFRRTMPGLDKSPSVIATLGGPHLGRDLFCFPKRWLTEHWDEIPDFILGASAWDLCMAAMIRLEYGITTTKQTISENILPAEIERGYVAHEAHEAAWSRRENRRSASERWNKSLFRNWSLKHLPALRFNPENEI